VQISTFDVEDVNELLNYLDLELMLDQPVGN
jgi:hypothetical protein